MLILAVLHAQGVRDVTVSEPSPSRRVRALEVGAARGRRARRPAAGARWVVPVPEPYSVVFECSGNAAAARAALDQVDFAGTFVFVGTGHDQPRVNHNRVIILELTLIGAYNYDAAGWGPALDLLASGALPLDAADRRRRRAARRAAARDGAPRRRRDPGQGDGAYPERSGSERNPEEGVDR